MVDCNWNFARRDWKKLIKLIETDVVFEFTKMQMNKHWVQFNGTLNFTFFLILLPEEDFTLNSRRIRRLIVIESLEFEKSDKNGDLNHQKKIFGYVFLKKLS